MINPDNHVNELNDKRVPKITIIDKMLVFITSSMDPVPMIALLFVLSTITLIANVHHRNVFIKEMTLLIISVIPVVIGSIIKKLIAKPRPDQKEAKIIIKTNSYSWPSTHSAVAISFYGFLAFLSIYNHLPSYLAFLSIAMIFLISYSRVHLSVHYIQDILAGHVLGSFTLALLICAFFYLPDFLFSAKSFLALLIVSWFFTINYYRKYPEEIPLIIKKLGTTIKRIITGLVVFIISFAAVWIGDKTFFVFMAFITIAGIWEIHCANSKMNHSTTRFVGIVSIVLMAYAIILLRNLTLGKTYALIFIFSSTISDVSGYFIGKFFGKIKIFGTVSPNKTLEGVFAAILIPSIIIGSCLIPHCSLSYVLIIILSVSAITGDYLESLLKRKLQIKDFSNFLPGHGGILDRVDSALFTGFVFYLLIQLKIFTIH